MNEIRDLLAKRRENKLWCTGAMMKTASRDFWSLLPGCSGCPWTRRRHRGRAGGWRGGDAAKEVSYAGKVVTIEIRKPRATWMTCGSFLAIGKKALEASGARRKARAVVLADRFGGWLHAEATREAHGPAAPISPRCRPMPFVEEPGAGWRCDVGGFDRESIYMKPRGRHRRGAGFRWERMPM